MKRIEYGKSKWAGHIVELSEKKIRENNIQQKTSQMSAASWTTTMNKELHTKQNAEIEIYPWVLAVIIIVEFLLSVKFRLSSA